MTHPNKKNYTFEDKPKNVSLRQLLYAYLLITLCLSGWHIPNTVAKSGAFGYLGVVASGIVLVVFVCSVGSALKMLPELSLGDMCELSFGKIIGRAVIFLYFLWAGLKAYVQLEYYAITFQTTILPYSKTAVFTLSGLILVAYALLKINKSKTLLRFAELCLPIVAVIILMLFIVAIPAVNTDNFRGFTPQKAVRSVLDAKAWVQTLSVGGNLVLVLFFTDRIARSRCGKNQQKRLTISTIAFVSFAVVMTVLCIGVSGDKALAEQSFPLFSLCRRIDFFGVIERVESFVLILSGLSCFLFVALFSGISVTCFRRAFRIRHEKLPTVVFLAMLFVASLVFLDTQFEVQRFYYRLMPYANLIFEFAFPAIIILSALIKTKGGKTLLAK